MKITIQDRINELVGEQGSLRAAALAIFIDEGFLKRLRDNKKGYNPNKSVLNRLGIERKYYYVRKQEHDFIKTGDKDSFPQIEDRNGEVCLAYCRRCREAEAGLDDSCPGTPENLLSHKDAWRKALSLCVEAAVNEEDKLYWTHELKAFDLMHEKLKVDNE